MKSRRRHTSQARIPRASFISDANVERAGETLKELLNAKKTVRGVKLPGGGYSRIEVPNFRVRAHAAMAILELVLGKRK
jgi:hypothetical protein